MNKFCEICKGQCYNPEEAKRQTQAVRMVGIIPQPCEKNDTCPYKDTKPQKQ